MEPVVRTVYGDVRGLVSNGVAGPNAPLVRARCGPDAACGPDAGRR